MPSEKLSIERILPTKWHFEYDSGPPGYERKVLDFPTLAEAMAAVREVAAKIEPLGTVAVAEESSATFAADTATAMPAGEAA